MLFKRIVKTIIDSIPFFSAITAHRSARSQSHLMEGSRPDTTFKFKQPDSTIKTELPYSVGSYPHLGGDVT